MRGLRHNKVFTSAWDDGALLYGEAHSEDMVICRGFQEPYPDWLLQSAVLS